MQVFLYFDERFYFDNVRLRLLFVLFIERLRMFLVGGRIQLYVVVYFEMIDFIFFEVGKEFGKLLLFLDEEDFDDYRILLQRYRFI